SNADLPIVGGSILTHDHFQGGRHTFPIEKAEVDVVYRNEAFPQVTAGIVNWPMSVIRFTSTDVEALLEAGNAAFEAWKTYSDRAVDVLSHTEQDGEAVPHNTVTPIVRRDAEGKYQMDLVLRNNRTSDEYPEGIFHPHREMHHIKKENIGLIEVMGLAILPGRLKDELDEIADILCGNDELAVAMQQEGHPLFKHADWIYQLNT
ncbi:galactose-1-phosphate uridylyltransferase, partial [Paenibacillus sp. 28ISP30-2]|nr:galactose-1-phosphate uridylyltransferase [Paenibacillus sp. 28ISP30-2]